MNNILDAGSFWQAADQKIHKILDISEGHVTTFTDYREAPLASGATFYGPIPLFLSQFKKVADSK